MSLGVVGDAAFSAGWQTEDCSGSSRDVPAICCCDGSAKLRSAGARSGASRV